MKPKPPIHLLLRFSDTLLKTGDTIDEHNQVVESEGSVWFGKMGSTVSQSQIDVLNGQVQDAIPTYVCLVKGNRRKSAAFRGRLVLASKTLPKGEENRVPSYYTDLSIPRYVKFWVKLTKIVPIDSADLNMMQVASSVLPIRETLFRSSSGHFFLCEDRLSY